MNIDEFMDALFTYIDKKGMTFFTGAGLSTASGIRDFNGENGLYKEKVDGREILSHKFLEEKPLEFYNFFRKYLINENIKPNLMHEVIAELQKEGVVRSILTQNIDGLDTVAGSKEVIELHGNACKFHCVNCNRNYSLSDIIGMDIVPKCSCGGLIRPDIILYGEQPDPYLLNISRNMIRYSNSVLVLGTELDVDPAANLVRDFIGEKKTYMGRHKKLFIVNKDATDYDYFADYKYDGDIMEVAQKIKEYRKGV